jgi:hypothetical protein
MNFAIVKFCPLLNVHMSFVPRPTVISDGVALKFQHLKEYCIDLIIFT